MLEEYEEKKKKKINLKKNTDILNTTEVILNNNATKKDIGKMREQSTYVIQKHNTTRLNFDFSLEYSGILKSWTVPEGFSDDSSEKRLAIMIEDKAIANSDFAGNISKIEYEEGNVEIWDRGKYVNITVKNNKVQPLKHAIEKGNFIIHLKGEKLNGTFAFTRTEGNNWIIVKKKETKKPQDEIWFKDKQIKITNPTKDIARGIKKFELIEYYEKVAPLMLPHIKDRLISMLRFPQGVEGKKFFQKNSPDSFPDWIPIKCIKDKEEQICYVIIKDEAGIIYLSNQVVEPHIMSNKEGELPDKIIFDLDTSKNNINELKHAAKLIGDFLTSLGFTPFIMTTGGRGYHIIVPIKQELESEEIKDFALKLANILEKNNDIITTKSPNNKGDEKIFVDINRNGKSQISIAPYAIRAKQKLPIAAPFSWDELQNINPDSYTIRNYPKDNAWKDFYEHQVSIVDVQNKIKAQSKTKIKTK